MGPYVRLLALAVAMVMSVINYASASERIYMIPLAHDTSFTIANYVDDAVAYNNACPGDTYDGYFQHEGIDFILTVGTPIYAAASGTVTHQSQSCSADLCYGNYLYINHGNSNWTLYAHLSSYVASNGQYVNQGDLIAYSGTSGTSTPHLHWEVLTGSNPISGSPQNPYYCDNEWFTSTPPGYADQITTCSVVDTNSVVLTQVDNNTQVITWEDDESNSQVLAQFGPVTNGPSGTVRQWFTGRFTNDAWDDVLVSSTSGNTRTFWVYEATGDGEFLAPQSWKTRQELTVNLVLVGDTDNDDDLDLVIGDKNSTNQYQWSICPNNGSSFAATCTAWNNNSQTNHRFGVQGNTFLLADLDGVGGVELLRGWNASACNSSTQKRWHRLMPDGTMNMIASCWGHRSAQFLAGNVDTDTADELVTVRTTDNDVEVFVQGHTPAQWATDVGGQDGWYYLYDFNADNRDDLIRWGSNGKVAWMANNGNSTFQEQEQDGTIIETLTRDSNDTLLFGDFGEVEEVECTPTYSSTAASPWASAYADGSLLQYNNTVYWYTSGALRGIVSPDAFNSCGFNWAAITDISTEVFNSLPQGMVVDDPVDCGMLVQGDLFTGPTPGTVFWYTGGTKRGIVSPDAFNACGFDWNAIEVYPWSTTLIQIPDGGVIDDPVDCGMLVEGDVFTGPTPGTVFWYTGGTKHGIVSPDAFNSCGFNWNAIEVYPWSTTLIQIPDGGVIDGPEDCW